MTLLMVCLHCRMFANMTNALLRYQSILLCFFWKHCPPSTIFTATFQSADNN